METKRLIEYSCSLLEEDHPMTLRQLHYAIFSRNAKLSSATGRVGFEVSNWKPYTKNTLQAFLSLTLPSGMTLHGCSYHRKNDSRWIGVPGQKFTKADGSVSYTPIIEFTSDDANRRFKEQAIAAVDRYLEASVERT
jgi:hypothetical protein